MCCCLRIILPFPLSLPARQNISRLRERHLVVMVGDEELCRGGAAAPSPETEGSGWAFDLSQFEISSLQDEGESASTTTSSSTATAGKEVGT